jgi:hypothetical protein
MEFAFCGRADQRDWKGDSVTGTMNNSSNLFHFYFSKSSVPRLACAFTVSERYRRIPTEYYDAKRLLYPNSMPKPKRRFSSSYSRSFLDYAPILRPNSE